MKHVKLLSVTSRKSTLTGQYMAVTLDAYVNTGKEWRVYSRVISKRNEIIMALKEIIGSPSWQIEHEFGSLLLSPTTSVKVYHLHSTALLAAFDKVINKIDVDIPFNMKSFVNDIFICSMHDKRGYKRFRL